MARKKAVSTESEFPDFGTEETPQYPDGEVPAENGQDDVPTGDTPESEDPSSDAPPFDGGTASEVPEGEEPCNVNDDGDAAEDSAADTPSSDAFSTEEAAEPQYEVLLHEIGVESPFPVADDGTENSDGDMPLMGPPGGEPLEGKEDTPLSESMSTETSDEGEVSAERASRPRSRRTPAQRSDYVLTIDARDRVQTEEEREEIIWHEVRNAYRTRRILTGILGGVERRKPAGRWRLWTTRASGWRFLFWK